MANSIVYYSPANPRERVFADEAVSRKTEKVYLELPPHYVDPSTGEVLNPTDEKILIENGEVNIYDKIQSFAHETDIYELLKKVESTGDTSLLRQRPDVAYGDISKIPNNRNDLDAKLEKDISSASSLSPELKEAVVAGVSGYQLDILIKSHVEKLLASRGIVEPVEKEAAVSDDKKEVK